MIKNWMPKRRQLFQQLSLAGSTSLLSSTADRVLAQAKGVSAPHRFVFVVKSSGLTPESLVPSEWRDELVDAEAPSQYRDRYEVRASLRSTSKLVDRELGVVTLPESLTPLAPLQNRMLILQGLSGNMVNGGHTSGFGAMSCFRGNGGPDRSGIPVGETVDHMLARANPGVFKHLGFSLMENTIGKKAADSICYPGISSAGPGKSLPYHGNPLQAFDTLFGAALNGVGKARFDSRTRILDFMSTDVRRLQAKVAGSERIKLDAHLNAIDELQKRQTALQDQTAKLNRGMPTVSAEQFESSKPVDRVRAFFDLAAGALISGLTNVITIRPDGLGTTYRELDGSPMGTSVHGIGHGGAPPGMTPSSARSVIRKFQLEQIARLARKLDAVPEGNGTMLDNTTIIYFSDVGEQHHATNREWPFVVIGNADGRISQSGRYLQYPGKTAAEHRTIANWWMTILQGTDWHGDQFGELDDELDPKIQRGPLSELIA